jgi:hypothetical protein
MSAPTPRPAPSADRDWIYWVIGAVVLVLTVIGLISYSGKKETQEAQDKAGQLTQKLEQAGLPVPEDQDIFVRSLGDDGGNVCDNPGNALGRATLFSLFTNGASHVGQRPVIVDRRLIEGQLLIMETYCPDKLEDFREEVEDLEFDDTIEN